MEMVEVWFDGKAETRDPVYGMPLTPGVNTIEKDRAELLLLRRVVREVERSRRR